MSNDELQALVDIISKMTDGTVTAIIWILAAKYGSGIVSSLIFSGTVITSTKSGKSLGVKARDGLSSWTPKQQMKAA